MTNDRTSEPKPTPKRERAAAGNDYLRANNARIGRAIRAARENHGLSRSALADAMQEWGATHMHESTIYEIERGRQAVRAAEIADFAQVLGVEVADIVSSPLDLPSQWLQRAVAEHGGLSMRVARAFREWDESRGRVVTALDEFDATEAEEMARRDADLWRAAEAVRDQTPWTWVGPILAHVWPETFAASRRTGTHDSTRPEPGATEQEHES